MIDGNWYAETKLERKKNPRGWIIASHEDVILNPPQQTLDEYHKIEQLFYDKKNVSFNIDKGEAMLFDREGCFLIRKYEEKNN